MSETTYKLSFHMSLEPEVKEGQVAVQMPWTGMWLVGPLTEDDVVRMQRQADQDSRDYGYPPQTLAVVRGPRSS